MTPNTNTFFQNSELQGLKHLDTEQGLKHLGGDTKVYLKVLQDFKERYRDFMLVDLESEKSMEALHTLKGLSGNIGATTLYPIVKHLYETLDPTLTSLLYDELRCVISEIEEKMEEPNRQMVQKHQLPHERRDNLFQNLEKGLERERIQLCEPVLEELKFYRLSRNDQEMFDKISTALNSFDFDEALKALKQGKGTKP